LEKVGAAGDGAWAQTPAGRAQTAVAATMIATNDEGRASGKRLKRGLTLSLHRNGKRHENANIVCVLAV
jgi:hypothetical protein